MAGPVEHHEDEDACEAHAEEWWPAAVAASIGRLRHTPNSTDPVIVLDIEDFRTTDERPLIDEILIRAEGGPLLDDSDAMTTLTATRDPRRAMSHVTPSGRLAHRWRKIVAETWRPIRPRVRVPG